MLSGHALYELEMFYEFPRYRDAIRANRMAQALIYKDKQAN